MPHEGGVSRSSRLVFFRVFMISFSRRLVPESESLSAKPVAIRVNLTSFVILGSSATPKITLAWGQPPGG